MTASRITNAGLTAFPVLLDVPTERSCEDPSSAQPSVAQSGHGQINTDPEGHQGERLRASSAASSLNHCRPYRKLSPGLAARMKLLDITNRKSRVLSSPALGTDKIGRIPESQIRGLENLHNSRGCEIERRGRAWSHNDRPPTEERFTSVAISGNNISRTRELDDAYSDRSSVVSTEANMSEPSGDELDTINVETHKYRLPEMGKVLQRTTDDLPTVGDAQSTSNAFPPPPPPPKDRPDTATTSGANTGSEQESPNPASSSESLQSYFHPGSLSRANSIYTLSRVSFSNQLSQLTALKLPQASALSESVLGMPTAPAASKALGGAAEQIRKWIGKAAEVLSGLDADDDVEWAAAGGREGLSEVDNAVGRFERLIEVYISAIEQVQLRRDISSVQKSELKSLVEQMEKTVEEWQRVRHLLKGVKEQVEVAMEFEELWGVVLGDIGLEMESLSRLVFEMEEKRHKALSVDGSSDGVFGLDLVELQTIVEEKPTNEGRATANHRFSLPAFSSSSPMQSPRPSIAQDDSNLLALFARMQPLRASLDFLPMRLATFHTRAELKFPTACEELESRRKVLEKRWQKLEGDAEALRCELGEDRWVLVFRNAGRQAQKMCESVGRSLSKLFEAVDSGAQHNSPTSLAKKIESYEAKKTHYGPAIERVLAITEKGINERLTVNGEILRLYAEMKKRYEAMQSQMREMDTALEELNSSRSQQLRDSISTIISIDRSTAGSYDTPGSSPASSVIMTGRANSIKSMTADEPRVTPTLAESSSRPSGRRHASMPANSHLPRKTPTSRSSASTSGLASRGPTPSPGSRPSSLTPNPNQRPPPPNTDPNKPRWNSSTNINNTPLGHNFKPLSLTTPSPYRKISAIVRTPRSATSNSSLPLPSPLGREGSLSPAPSSPSLPPSRRTSGSYGTLSFHGSKSSLPSPLQSLHSMSYSSPSGEIRRPGMKTQASTPQLSKTTRRRSTLIQQEELSGTEED
ncbi:MAG: hypothetical protein M1835_005862, partial [Candelina submexicana]